MTPEALLWALAGVLIGTAIGILPGIGATAAVALLIPFALALEPLPGLSMLLAVYYGAKYGGSTTAILLNIPGEPSAVVTCLDGHALARRGRAGAAIAIAAIASFVAGIAGIGLLALLLPLATLFPTLVGPIEHFALVTLGLALVVALIGDRPLKGAVAVLLGLLLSFVGSDIISGSTRLTFGRPELLDGIGLVPLTVGLFAIGEVLTNIWRGPRALPAPPRAWLDLLPSVPDLRASARPIAQSSVIGFLIGVVPGAGATVASFLSYAAARGASPHPERFGSGAIEGVAASEAANNSEPMGALVPFFALGIPGSGTTAVLLGALPAWGIHAGPLFVREQSALLWALLGTAIVGNVLLLLVNLPLAPVFARVLLLPERLLAAVVIATAVIGVYMLERDPFDLILLALFGLAGFALRSAGVPLAALVLAFVLGSVVERDLRAALILTGGDPLALLARPLAAVLLVAGAGVLAAPLVRRVRRQTA